MKKYGIIAAIALVLVAGLVGWRMWSRNHDDMSTSLPKELMMVGKVDMKSFFLENGKKWSEVRKMIALDHKKVGLDLQSPAYVFASQGYLGAVVAVDNDDDFKDFLSGKGCDVKQLRGLNWSVVLDNFLVGFNSNRAILMGPAVGSEQEALYGVIAGLIEQNATESGIGSHLYELMQGRTEPVALAANMGAFMQLPVLNQLEEKGGVYSTLQALDVTAGLSYLQDKVSLAMSVETEDKKTTKLLAALDEVFMPANASLLERDPDNTLFHMEVGLNGERLLELLRTNPDVRTTLLLANSIFDLDLILKSIKGDVSLTVPQISLGSQEVQFQAQLVDDSFMQNISTWNDAVSRAAGVYFYPQRDDRYMAVFKGTPCYFSVAGKRLYLSNSDRLASPQSHHDVAYDLQDEMRQYRVYGNLNVKSVAPLLAVVPHAGFLSRIERVVLAMPNMREMKIEFVTRPHD